MSNITYIWDDVDNYLQYFGGTTGALALAGITAASVYYYVSRPVPEKPLVPLHNQGPILELTPERVVQDSVKIEEIISRIQ
ncbi:unnamed protein product [Hermetia illucens]|uniref:Uncharacterized protein n=1 Tax=Hermetia illucens TaxID=343691 RepID=A0A7R8UI64_HERIL|nr:unnamed protein product [Hermetia illucens]